MVELERAKENPILLPEYEWEKRGVFNPTIIKRRGSVIMLYRAVDKKGISRIGIAYSKDGIHFEKNKYPLIEPTESYEKMGCEDPRLTYIKEDDKYYLTYVALRDKEAAPKTALAISKDLDNFEKVGLISEDYNKDVVIFSKKFDEYYALLHRPYSKSIYNETGKPSIKISFHKRLSCMLREGKVLVKPTDEGKKVGAGFVLKVKSYWLLIYHEVLSKGEYVAKAALLDYAYPYELIGKTREPILYPKEKYEVKGVVNNVVFPTGGFVDKGKLYVYYGAADYSVGLASIEVNELLRCIMTTTD